MIVARRRIEYSDRCLSVARPFDSAGQEYAPAAMGREDAALTRPAAVHWVDGSQEEYDALCAQMVASGTFIKLNEDLWPGCFYARSDASDVARVEQRTFVCSLSKDAAGPTNNWVNPFEMRAHAEGDVQRRDGRADDVRAGVQHGPGRLADVADRRAAHRLALRRRQHADHGAHRPAGARRDRQGREARRAVHAHRRRAARAGRGTCPGRAIRRSTSSIFRRRARSGRTGPATAATRCSARSASRCGSRRASRATRAGWPSTC